MMPFYGRFDHFRVAVESVMAQHDPDWRLVIIDDVYPDLAPGEWAGSIADERVSYIRNETNLRPSRNYNKAVTLAQSEFMVLMGCDDAMLPDFVGRVKQLVAEHPRASVFQPGVSVMNEHGALTRPLADRVKAVLRPSGSGARAYHGEYLATSLLRGNWTYFPSIVWRTSELVRGFRTDLDVVQDLAMLMEIIKAGGELVLDDRTVFHYRRHSTSLSAVTGTDGSKFAQEQVLFDEVAAACTELGWPKAARAARNHVTSRFNALSELPGSISSRNRIGRIALTRHVFGTGSSATSGGSAGKLNK
jgi:hypothetical protein